MKKIAFATALLVALSAYAVPAPTTAPEWASIPLQADSVISEEQITPPQGASGGGLTLLQEIQVTSTRAGSRTPMNLR